MSGNLRVSYSLGDRREQIEKNLNFKNKSAILLMYNRPIIELNDRIFIL